MNDTKTITLNGGEQKIEGMNGQNTIIVNRGTSTVYASTRANVTPDGDGTAAIPPGWMMNLYGTNGTLYLLGTGKVQLEGTDISWLPISSGGSGGSSGDGVSQAYVDDADASTLKAAKDYTNAEIVRVEEKIPEVVPGLTTQQLDTMLDRIFNPPTTDYLFLKFDGNLDNSGIGEFEITASNYEGSTPAFETHGKGQCLQICPSTTNKRFTMFTIDTKTLLSGDWIMEFDYQGTANTSSSFLTINMSNNSDWKLYFTYNVGSLDVHTATTTHTYLARFDSPTSSIWRHISLTKENDNITIVHDESKTHSFAHNLDSIINFGVFHTNNFGLRIDNFKLKAI